MYSPRLNDYKTSMHYPTGMHVAQGSADLNEIFPNGSLRDLPSLFLEMLVAS